EKFAGRNTDRDVSEGGDVLRSLAVLLGDVVEDDDGIIGHRGLRRHSARLRRGADLRPEDRLAWPTGCARIGLLAALLSRTCAARKSRRRLYALQSLRTPGDPLSSAASLTSAATVGSIAAHDNAAPSHPLRHRECSLAAAATILRLHQGSDGPWSSRLASQRR